MHTLTTYHHATGTPPGDAALLHLDGTGGPIANTVVMPEGTAPPGRVLVSSTVVGPAIPEPEIRREVARIYGASTDGWELLRVDEVRDALPAFPAGRPLRSPVELGEGLFVAGRPPRHPVATGRAGVRPPRRRSGPPSPEGLATGRSCCDRGGMAPETRQDRSEGLRDVAGAGERGGVLGPRGRRSASGGSGWR
jgi:hypothetical protein